MSAPSSHPPESCSWREQIFRTPLCSSRNASPVTELPGHIFHLRSAAMTGKFAIVTGASTGIGLELARCCAKDGYNLLIAADEAAIEDAASVLRQEPGAANIQALKVDLATTEALTSSLRRLPGAPS